MAIAEGITATRAAVEVAKILLDRLNKPNYSVDDIRLKVQEMLIHGVNAQLSLNEAQIEISDLRHKLDEREAWKALNDDMEFTNDGHVYIKKSEQAAGRVIRYCPLCWKSDGKDIPLAPLSTGALKCELHDSFYFTQEYHDNKARKQAEAEARARSGRGRYETII